MATRSKIAPYLLTHQQRRVLELIAAGLSHAQIADALNVGRQTVRGHIVKICDRYFAKDAHFRAFIKSKLLEDEGDP